MKKSAKLKVTMIFPLLLILISFVSSLHTDANADNGNSSNSYATTGSSFDTAQPLLPSFAAAEVPELLKDILVGSGSSITAPSGVQPSGFLEAGGALFFVADNGINGKELWRTDGTPAGTQMVKDIFPRPNSSSAFPHKLVEVAGLIYFAANDGTSGTELWRSDGTEAGTFRIKDIFPGARSSNPRELVKLGEALLFNAEDGTTSQELWRSDGTEDGTLLLKDINPGFFGSEPRLLTSVANTLCFFTASDNAEESFGGVTAPRWARFGPKISFLSQAVRPLRPSL